MKLLTRPSLQNLIDKKDLVCAEVGVKRGVNAKDMLTKLSIKKLYLIDNWITKHSSEEITLKNLEKFKDKIVTLTGESSKVCNNIKDEELDFVYIDADHKYKGIKKDIESYYPKVKIGGLICGHDYFERKDRGVIKAVDEFFGKKNINTVLCLDSPEKTKVYDWWIWKK